MQQGDYTASYYQYNPQPPPHLQNANPAPISNPNSIDPQPTYASAPPFSNNYSSDFSTYPHNYPPYPQNPDPLPPTAPSYSPNPNLQIPSFPPIQETNPQYQPPITPQSSQSYYPPFDQHQTASNYSQSLPPSSIPSNPNPNPNPSYSSSYTVPYSQIEGSIYENPYDSSVKYDQSGGYFDDRYGGGGASTHGRSRSDLGSELYGKRSDSGISRYESRGSRDDAYGDGVYAYQGSEVEPYGARGTSSKSSTWSSGLAFDDYGRAIGFDSGKDQTSLPKVVRAVPKAETQQDVKSGMQKFRVKLLAESGGQSTMDVLCQIGLDGIRMLDPGTSRTLRIYPLENVTRCEVTDSSTLAFWSESSVDIEPRRIRLQSNSYTTNTLLDAITAATVQIKEMGGRIKPSESFKADEQPSEKKKGFGEWMNFMKPANEEKDHWVPDEAVTKCTSCGTDFSAFHHCRNCGDIFCDKCTHGRIALTAEEYAQPVRVCDRCLAEVTQRLSNAKEVASKPAGLQSHEDLAKKLQEEMERNRRTSSGSKSDGSGRRMREVACPICTVHLQVQVPSSGSETIECGVCQHPFLVSAH
ncbi:FYVE zinc finger [Dillenia turbinata]|uniref:FYVE zinc finger n=1 Tax=Dillenia turbinata TaxID=194707 RepID=A0AAN8W2Y0_9MAGN